MSKKELVSYLLAQNTALSPAQILLSLTAAVLLALLMYFVYRKTFSGVVYSKNFNSTLVLIAVITTLAMLAIGSNLAASVLTVMNLKELAVPYVICKAHDETHRRVLEKLGVDRVVIPEQENAARLARSLNSHNVLDYIELSEEYGILEIPAPKSWIGKTLKELNVRAKLGLNIIAVESGKKTNVSPSADYQIREGDVMVVLGDNYSLEAVQKL